MLPHDLRRNARRHPHWSQRQPDYDDSGFALITIIIATYSSFIYIFSFLCVLRFFDFINSADRTRYYRKCWTFVQITQTEFTIAKSFSRWSSVQYRLTKLRSVLPAPLSTLLSHNMYHMPTQLSFSRNKLTIVYRKFKIFDWKGLILYLINRVAMTLWS